MNKVKYSSIIAISFISQNLIKSLIDFNSGLFQFNLNKRQTVNKKRHIKSTSITTCGFYLVSNFKTVFLNVNAETGLARIQANRAVLDRLDAESEEFHKRVYDGYQKVIAQYGDRMIVVDASRDVHEVIAEVYSIVKGLLDD